jgi:hypothetical protein
MSPYHTLRSFDKRHGGRCGEGDSVEDEMSTGINGIRMGDIVFGVFEIDGAGGSGLLLGSATITLHA